MFARLTPRILLTRAKRKPNTTHFAYQPSTLKMLSTLPRLPIFEAISKYDTKTTSVIHSGSGRQFTYGELLHDVRDARDKLQEWAGKEELAGQRIAFLVENGYDYIGAKASISLLYNGALIVIQ